MFACLVVQHFSLVHEVHLVSWDRSLSFHYFRKSFCILSSVAFDAECLHIHYHVGHLNAILDHAFLKYLVILLRSEREDVIRELVFSLTCTV